MGLVCVGFRKVTNKSLSYLCYELGPDWMDTMIYITVEIEREGKTDCGIKSLISNLPQ